MLELSMPEEIGDFDGNSTDDACLYHKFNKQYWRNLFSPDDYLNIEVVSPYQCENALHQNSTDIIVEVSCDVPTRSFIVWNGMKHKSQVIICINIEKCCHINRNSFSAMRYICHGRGYMKWWEQIRCLNSPQLMKKPSASSCWNLTFRHYLRIFYITYPSLWRVDNLMLTC